MLKVFKNLDTAVNNALNNNYVKGLLTLVTILYASMARPELPQYIANLFDSGLFRVVFCALIVFLASKSTMVAILVALVFTVTMNLLNEQKIAEGFRAGINEVTNFNEGFNEDADLTNNTVENGINAITTVNA